MIKRLLAIVFLCFSLVAGALAAVDVNTADEKELDSVKGIGPAKAKAIVEYRKAHGPFKSLDELTQVKGIKDKTLAKVRDQLSVGASAAAAPAKAAVPAATPAPAAPAADAKAKPETKAKAKADAK